VNLCLEVQLDADQERRVFEVALVVYSAFDDIACWAAEPGGSWDRSNVAGDLAAARGLTVAIGIGVVASRTHGGWLAGAGRRLVLFRKQ
jgi:hypothetical protein